MEYFFYFCLFIFGTLFGSFGSVIIYRLKSGEGGISSGRSHCPKCNTILKALDLLPIISWVVNKAKCRYCKEKVSSIYPLLELSTGILFYFIGYFLIDFNLISEINILEITKLLFWLSIGFITILYTFYDILFLEIHEGILLTGTGIILVGLGAQTLFQDIVLINVLPSGIENLSIGISAIFITLIIIGILYIIMLKELHEIIDISLILLSIGILYLFKIQTGINLSDIAILNGLIGVLIIFLFFFTQIMISRGKWMGGGDLRIAIMIGLILGVSFSPPGLMLTYMAGSIIGTLFIIQNRIKNKGGNLNTQIPFGPFLAIGFFLTIFYSTEIGNIISIYF
ncbi:MAG: prepilin peptidase [Candidatus Gracilibacteria bacterium]